MAWWTDIIFKKRPDSNGANEGQQENLSFSESFRRTLKKYLYENFVDLLHFSLKFFTFLYLAISVLGFFFQKYLPDTYSHVIDALSEPYLLSLALYVVVKEVEKKNIPEPLRKKRSGELLVAFWLFLLLVSSALVLLVGEFPVNEIYKAIVSNSLGAIVIRIGTFIR